MHRTRSAVMRAIWSDNYRMVLCVMETCRRLRELASCCAVWRELCREHWRSKLPHFHLDRRTGAPSELLFAALALGCFLKHDLPKGIILCSCAGRDGSRISNALRSPPLFDHFTCLKRVTAPSGRRLRSTRAEPVLRARRSAASHGRGLSSPTVFGLHCSSGALSVSRPTYLWFPLS